MTKRMLIDATDPAETRVVVLSRNRVEEFDREVRSHAQLKGNIYLAKVTRVEPSLQAAFVDYGGNRHGFLPFSEIHPDYYRIPVADREALLAEEAALKSTLDLDEDDEGPEENEPPRRNRRRSAKAYEQADEETDDEDDTAESAADIDDDDEIEEENDDDEEVAASADAPEQAEPLSVADSAEPADDETEQRAAPDAADPDEQTHEAMPADEPEAQDQETAAQDESDRADDTLADDETASEDRSDDDEPKGPGGRSMPHVASTGEQRSSDPLDEGRDESDSGKGGDASPAHAPSDSITHQESSETGAGSQSDEGQAAPAATAEGEEAEAHGKSESEEDQPTRGRRSSRRRPNGMRGLRRGRGRRPANTRRDESDGQEKPARNDEEQAEQQANSSEDAEQERPRSRDGDRRDERARERVEQVEVETQVDTLDGDDIEDAARRRAKLLRRYKIQEVIKRGQIMLVQVAKEERGNKGAALTTYLSLPGRYCVLMPNTARGGGISRKIGSAADRRRLKQVLGEMEIPGGMAVIVRTAGSERSKTEIKRDYDYLIRLWDEIRQMTLSSQAPAMIYEEGNLIKRAIRDLYTSDMEEIQVDGEEAYKAAKGLMRSLMPSHAKRVQLYRDQSVPLFQRFQVEPQLAGMFEPSVQLPSGGYLVMNTTEALVAIDVNSGKATRERHIEETALKTNLEAAEEIARQLRLRDLAGLVVVDFIDMEEPRHNREVERKLKEEMKNDRARIQLGRISPFGLLELSRQRLRPSLVDTAMLTCPHCRGTGKLYSPETSAMSVLRALAEEGMRRPGGSVIAYVPTAVALYLLNYKRQQLVQEEERSGLIIQIAVDDSLNGLEHRLERQQAPRGTRPERGEGRSDARTDTRSEGRSEGRSDNRSEGRRGNRRRDEEDSPRDAEHVNGALAYRDDEEDEDLEEDTDEGAEERQAGDQDSEQDDGKRRRRRGKRGGRRRGRRRDEEDQGQDTQAQSKEASESKPNGRHDDAERPDSDETGSNETAARSGTDEPAEDAEQRSEEQSATPDDAQQPGQSEPERAAAASDGNGHDRKDAAAESVNGSSEEREEPSPDDAKPDADTASAEGRDDAGGDAEEEPRHDPSYNVVTGPDPDQPKRKGWWNRLIR